MSEIANKLREARTLIERGWCQKHLKSAQGYCAVGAIIATNRNDLDNAAVALLARAARTDSVALWNDASRRTKPQVLAAFDKAIELAEASA